MIFTKLTLPGVYKIDLEKHTDERGFFARSFCTDEFITNNLQTSFIQSSLSFNSQKGTVRGMHWQEEPKGEIKLVQCLRGAIYDVLLDLRVDSPTYLKDLTIELNEDNLTTLYIPKGIAHGFQTLKDNTLIQYQMHERFSPEHARGVRWNDQAFSIHFPLPISSISEKDLSYPDFKEEK